MILALGVGVGLASAQTPVINEFVNNHTGADTHEFVEIFGDPSTSYSDYTILEIEGDTSRGVIDGVFPVGTSDANGFWTTAFLCSRSARATQTVSGPPPFSPTTSRTAPSRCSW